LSLIDASKTPAPTAAPEVEKLEGKEWKSTDGKFSFSWELNDDKDKVTFSVTYDGTGKYVALGFNTEGTTNMEPADVIVGYGGNVYDRANIASKAGPQVDDAQQDIEDARFEEEDGQTTMVFTRKFNTGDAEDFVIPASGDVDIIWAFGDVDGSSLKRHADRGGLKLNLDSGDAEATADKTAAKRAHGVLMFIAWGLLAPLGVYFARFGKDYKKQTKGFWFHYVHKPAMISVVVIGVIAFVVALTFVSEGSSSSTRTIHAVVGFITMFLAIMQPINAAFRGSGHDHNTPERKRFEFLHKNGGRIALPLSWIAILLGLASVGEDTALPVFIVWLVLLVVAFVYLTVKAKPAEEKPKKQPEEVGLKNVQGNA